MPSKLDLNAPCSVLHGVGPTALQRLAKLKIHTIADLLWHIPFRYDDYRSLCAIGDVRIGQTVTVAGTIEIIANRRSFRRRLSVTEALVQDESGTIKVVWFNQPYLTNTLHPGDRVMLSGKVTSRSGSLQLASPAYEKLDRREPLHVGRLVPIYPTTAGLTERQLRYFLSQAIPLADELPDPVPETVWKREGLLSLAQTLAHIHFPDDERMRDAALERLKFDELLTFQLGRLLAERKTKLLSSFPIPFHTSAVKTFVAALPFSLTNGQRRAAWDILQDMTTATPMFRLLEGDVGSGKTVVAALAAANVLAAGFSVALMAPTEILARQHYLTFREWFAKTATSVVLRTHSFHESTAAKPRKGKTEQAPWITIGTQALLEHGVDLGTLGLVVIDEQHRFGVAHRRTLQAKRGAFVPHLLSLTATPIPRSLALTMAGDLKLSVLKTLPKGRKPITTVTVPPDRRLIAYRAASLAVRQGRQVFVIAPLIEPSDALGVASASALYEEVSRQFQGTRVGLLHGKLPGKAKDATLLAFARHELDILVATPVVEVGIDVPNATVMIIEGAERFGLAQLHQLRGRVGRGEHASTCYLLAGAETPLTKRRLAAVAETTDGFKLAALDLELRGPGDLIGTTQSGFLDFRFATLGDHVLMERALRAANTLLEQDPKLEHAPLLKQQIRSVLPHKE